MAKVKFGDVVKETKGKIDQANNPYEYYVAGDHMDTEDLTIRRRGRFATDDVGPAFIREFHKGQVLYGSRRTYLKKIAVADFDGVTANTTFVLETKNEQVLRQRLLPFIMYTEGFTEWSIKKSKGSTNPYVLFKDLADYEFNLPPIEKQDELADLLWSMIEAKDAYNDLIAATDELVKSQFIEMFGKCQKVRLGEYILQVRGVSYKPVDLSLELDDEHITLLRANNIGGGIINFEEVQFVSRNKVSETQIIRNKDILMCASSGSLGHVGKTAICQFSGEYTFGAFCKLIRTTGAISPEYIAAYFQSDEYRKIISDLAQGTNINNLRNEHIDELMIPKPEKGKEIEFVSFLNQSDKSKFELKRALQEQHALYKQILKENLDS